jgi:hypothetical protein
MHEKQVVILTLPHLSVTYHVCRIDYSTTKTSNPAGYHHEVHFIHHLSGRSTPGADANTPAVCLTSLKARLLRPWSVYASTKVNRMPNMSAREDRYWIVTARPPHFCRGGNGLFAMVPAVEILIWKYWFARSNWRMWRTTLTTHGVNESSDRDQNDETVRMPWHLYIVGHCQNHRQHSKKMVGLVKGQFLECVIRRLKAVIIEFDQSYLVCSKCESPFRDAIRETDVPGELQKVIKHIISIALAIDRRQGLELRRGEWTMPVLPTTSKGQHQLFTGPNAGGRM